MNTSYNNVKNDSDIEKEAERFLDELKLNTVLKELSFEQRKEYYNLLENGFKEEATEFVKTNIPDLEDKLLNRIKEILLKRNS